jgi:GntR family transcriptional regulator
MTTVVPTLETAKQRQLRERIEQLISTLSPGEPLPAERELARELGVARMTLRRAIDALVSESRLIRRQGSGTFVAAAKVSQGLSATSFSQDMRARGLRPGGHTLVSRQTPAGVVLSSLLGVPPNSTVLHVRRLRMADDIPMALEDLHVPAAVAPGLTGDDLEDLSFCQLLGERWGRSIVSGTQTVEPCLVTAEDAAALDVAPGSPAFLFERTSRTDDGQIAEFVRSIYRGDRYRIVVDLVPPESSGA